MTTIPCESCGTAIESGPYCEHCVDETGALQDFDTRFERMMKDGIVRRIAIAPNHYALGMVANGMSVWDVDDAQAETLGEKVGALEFVSHSYLRPRAEGWPYNLFAMIHGSDRDAVEAHRGEIAAILGESCRARDILYSTRILKKTGMRFRKEG